jgi:hypothetical protein
MIEAIPASWVYTMYWPYSNFNMGFMGLCKNQSLTTHQDHAGMNVFKEGPIPRIKYENFEHTQYQDAAGMFRFSTRPVLEYSSPIHTNSGMFILFVMAFLLHHACIKFWVNFLPLGEQNHEV